MAVPILLLFLSLTHLAYGFNRVICTVPTSYATVQAAVNDTNCATIIVNAGTFSEYVTINRDVVIEGVSPGATIFDGQDAGRPQRV
jgi:hypothetical protein